MTTSTPSPGPRRDETAAAAGVAGPVPGVAADRGEDAAGLAQAGPSGAAAAVSLPPGACAATDTPGHSPALAMDGGEEAWWLALTAEDFAHQDEVVAIEQEAREAGRLPDIDPDDDEDWGWGWDADPASAPAVPADGAPGTPAAGMPAAGVSGMPADGAPRMSRPGEPAPVADLFPADLLDRGTDPGRADGPPFAKGSPLDVAPPGPVLAGKLEHTCRHGFGDLNDDQLAGMMLAAVRQQSRATAELLTAVDELAHRRAADPDPRVAEATDTEIAVTLAVTRRAAGRLLRFAGDLRQLPATRQALWDGRIDATKAELIGYETGLLHPALAAAVELLVIEDAPRLTTTALRARLRRAVIAADPAAARRRAEKARREARVELYDEQSGGTAALSGRDLPVAGALAADQRIDATARALKRAGVKATLAQLRAAVFLALLTGGDPRTFLPPTGEEDNGTAGRPAHDTSPARNTDADAQPSATGKGCQPPAAGSGTTPPGSSDPAATGPDAPDPAGTRDTTRPHPAGTPDRAGPAGAPDADGPEAPRTVRADGPAG